MKHLSIPDRRNAHKTLAWLKRAGFVEAEGALSSRGKKLLSEPDSADYQTAAREAFEAIVGKETADSIWAGTIRDLASHLRRVYALGDAVTAKVCGGLKVLAEGPPLTLTSWPPFLVAKPHILGAEPNGNRETTTHGDEDQGLLAHSR